MNNRKSFFLAAPFYLVFLSFFLIPLILTVIVSFWDYTIGLLGILPGTILFCGLGAVAGDIAQFSLVLSNHTDMKSFMLRVIGILATLGSVLIVTRSVRKVLQENED